MSAISPESNLADACLVAQTWGFDDALEGLRPRPAAYFGVGSPQWDAYEQGYLEGIEHIFHLPSTALKISVPTERPHDFLNDEEDRRRERRF